jgi:hypothetical protein
MSHAQAVTTAGKKRVNEMQLARYADFTVIAAHLAAITAFLRRAGQTGRQDASPMGRTGTSTSIRM